MTSASGTASRIRTSTPGTRTSATFVPCSGLDISSVLGLERLRSIVDLAFVVSLQTGVKGLEGIERDEQEL